jgi:preprotein translocase subunit SecA
VEAQNFAARKHLLEYDDVMNKQREAVYGMRRMILEGKDTRQYVLNLASEVLDWYFDSYTAENQDPEQWNLAGLRLALKETYGIDVPLDSLARWGGRRWPRPSPSASGPSTTRRSGRSARN